MQIKVEKGCGTHHCLVRPLLSGRIYFHASYCFKDLKYSRAGLVFIPLGSAFVLCRAYHLEANSQGWLLVFSSMNQSPWFLITLSLSLFLSFHLSPSLLLSHFPYFLFLCLHLEGFTWGCPMVLNKIPLKHALTKAWFMEKGRLWNWTTLGPKVNSFTSIFLGTISLISLKLCFVVFNNGDINNYISKLRKTNKIKV